MRKPKKIKINNDFKQMYQYIRPYMKYQIILFIICIIGAITSLIYPFLMQVIIDEVLIESDYELIKYIIICFVIMFFMSVFINFASGAYVTYINEQCKIKLKLNVFSYIQKIKLKNNLRNDVGEYMSCIIDDTNVISSFLTSTIMQILSSILSIIFTLFLMFYYNGLLSIIAFAVTLLKVYMSLKYKKKFKKNQDLIRQMMSFQMSFLKQSFTKIKQNKILHIEKRNNKKFFQILKNMFRLGIDNFKLEIELGTIMSFIGLFSSVLILMIGILLIRDGQMTIGMLFIFSTLSESFDGFAQSLININIEFQKVLIAFDRIKNIYEQPIEDFSGEYLNSHKINRVEFKNINFGYENHMVLNNLSLDLHRENSYCIVGKNGHGKSTLSNLLLRLYDIDQGEILLDGTSINEYSLHTLRRMICVVSQEVLIIRDTLYNNLLLGVKDIDPSRFSFLCKLFHIDDIANALPYGYDTVIDETIINLSDGQINKVSIVRALMRDADLYIFDECFSSLDKRSKREALAYVNSQNKFIIHITHDFEIVDENEIVIVINDGSVMVMGNPKQLRAESIEYNKMFHLNKTT